MIATRHKLEASLKAPGVTVEIRTHMLDRHAEMERDEPTYAMIHRYTRPDLTAKGCAGGRQGATRYVDIGPLQFTPANFPMRFTSISNEERIAECVFDTGRFEAVTGLAGRWRAEEIGAYLDIRDIGLSNAMRRLIAEVRQPGFGSLILAESLAQSMCVDLARYFRQSPRGADRSGRLCDRTLSRIEDFVRACCGEGVSPTVAEIAALCAVSPNYLMRSFKAATGDTLHRHVERIRIQLACDLLSERTLPMKVIAARAGFASASRFSESFRRHTGMSPRDYRVACGG